MKLYFLIPQHELKARLEYSIRLVSNMLGYPWKIINTCVPECKSGILVSYAAEYSELSVMDIPGINIYNSGLLYDLKNAREDIRLMEFGEHSVPVLGKLANLPADGGWKEHGQYRYFSKNNVSIWLTGFDLFVNIFYHISRFEEQGRRSVQEKPSDYTTSILARHTQLYIPVIDVLINYFDQLIRLKIIENKGLALRVLNWPGGEESGVAFTHDVDLTRGVGLKKRAWNTGLGLFRKMFGDRDALKKNRTTMTRQDAQVWSYPQLLDFYTHKKWKATFFFLAKKFEGIHYRYNIKSPQFQSLFDDLKNNNHEIGLHSSFNAFKHPKKYPAEKRKLETMVGIKCAGLRQHYLRALYPKLWKVSEAANFAYDSSLAYNFQPGFRAGTTHPFFTFDWERDRPLALLEFSLAFFEYNILNDSTDLSVARQIMQAIIAKVSHFHGLLVVLLHPSNFLQPTYRELWNCLIAELDRHRVYVDTLSGHYKWLKFREHIEIIPEHSHKTGEVWIVKKPIGLRMFSLEIVGAGRLSIPAEATIERIAEQCYTIQTDMTKVKLVIDRF
jgi:peptidoglycan/xylan/chitin deacetylase (PgdA/CDA1 family)